MCAHTHISVRCRPYSNTNTNAFTKRIHVIWSGVYRVCTIKWYVLAKPSSTITEKRRKGRWTFKWWLIETCVSKTLVRQKIQSFEDESKHSRYFTGNLRFKIRLHIYLDSNKKKNWIIRMWNVDAHPFIPFWTHLFGHHEECSFFSFRKETTFDQNFSNIPKFIQER